MNDPFKKMCEPTIWTHICSCPPDNTPYTRWTTFLDRCPNCGEIRPPKGEQYEDEMTPHQALQELYELLLKSARRSAYDFKHAIDHIRDKEMRDLFDERAREWLRIFQPDGMKNYRHELHMEIFKLESTINRYRELLAENNIEDTVEPPF